jgi:hypothetical protein
VGFEGGQMPLQRRLPKRGFKSQTLKYNGQITLSDLQALARRRSRPARAEAGRPGGRPDQDVKVIKTGELSPQGRAQGHRRHRRCQGCHRGRWRQRGGPRKAHVATNASTSWPRAASSATCVAGSSSLLLALVVYRIGAHIPVPGIDPSQLQSCSRASSGGILNLFNMFSGGALSRFTVFALGIMPYISASIIMQLMTYVVPTLEALKKEGEAGRRKITQYTRYGTLCWPSSSRWASRWRWKARRAWCSPGLGFRMTAVVSLVAGTMFLMWLGEQITERGLGNGISILIFAGIAAGCPARSAGLFELVRTGAMSIIACLFIIAVVGW